ncbi:hypothetical protein CAPTEDRAFT_185483 [Capitella teleta]|uniref:3CxxC-type domain-containing protein n=1 Tax=Capitella teleta TaxID=283909 RepID=R7VJH6_CAPTE|nr:hypothetical protein CAPTEDRAFT_185483 [Capitella teleta]|eukprot:ELU16521.1 hypothetical protein CAPTEDRAFT_185483 [Capitella teleta]
MSENSNGSEMRGVDAHVHHWTLTGSERKDDHQPSRLSVLRTGNPRSQIIVSQPLSMLPAPLNHEASGVIPPNQPHQTPPQMLPHPLQPMAMAYPPSLPPPHQGEGASAGPIQVTVGSVPATMPHPQMLPYPPMAMLEYQPLGSGRSQKAGPEEEERGPSGGDGPIQGASPAPREGPSDEGVPDGDPPQEKAVVSTPGVGDYAQFRWNGTTFFVNKNDPEAIARMNQRFLNNMPPTSQPVDSPALSELGSSGRSSPHSVILTATEYKGTTYYNRVDQAAALRNSQLANPVSVEVAIPGSSAASSPGLVLTGAPVVPMHPPHFYASHPPPVLVPVRLRNPSITTELHYVWHDHFDAKFGMFAERWFLAPKEFTSLKNYHVYKDSAKVRFCCPNCGNGWTSMKGRVIFWYWLDHANSTGMVEFRLFGQICKKCEHPDFVNAMWYPEEVIKVIDNLHVRIGVRHYGFPVSTLMNLERRHGRPQHQHDSSSENDDDKSQYLYMYYKCNGYITLCAPIHWRQVSAPIAHLLASDS